MRICKFCGFKNIWAKSFAIWKMKDGKTFLKRNGWTKFKEVELVKLKKGFQLKEKLATLF